MLHYKLEKTHLNFITFTGERAQAVCANVSHFKFFLISTTGKKNQDSHNWNRDRQLSCKALQCWITEQWNDTTNSVLIKPDCSF